MLNRFIFWRKSKFVSVAKSVLRRKLRYEHEDSVVVKCLNEVIPTFVPRSSLWVRIKKFSKIVFWLITIIVITATLCVVIFLGYRIIKDFDYFRHHLKENKTVAFTLSDTVSLQSPSIQEVLDKLTNQDDPLEQKLVEIAAEGYKGWYDESDLVVYNEKERAKYRQIYEERVLTAIQQAYNEIYNDYPITERKVYGITSDELVYQKSLTVQGYTPVTIIKQTLFEGRRYFPFALIAGEVSGIDPLRILKIFEIETQFSEIVVGKNSSSKKNNHDIGLGQNNLIVIPGLIRDMLDPKSPVYSPVFEFMTVCKDLKTKETLTWSKYLPRLEEELNGSYDKNIDPTGEYYINALKAPHICAFLVAYHIKRDQLLSCYSECHEFYKNKASELKKQFELAVDIDPSEWTDYTFYNGGPLRWQLVEEYLKRHNANAKISNGLKRAVRNTVRRNLKVQKIARKNQSLRELVYDRQKNKLVKNDGTSRYGLYDFTPEFKQSLLYNLKQDLSVVKDIEKSKEPNLVKRGM